MLSDTRRQSSAVLCRQYEVHRIHRVKWRHKIYGHDTVAIEALKASIIIRMCVFISIAGVASALISEDEHDDVKPSDDPLLATVYYTNYYYPRESFREGLCNHRRWFVCPSVCYNDN